jgi:hypothetical protein
MASTDLILITNLSIQSVLLCMALSIGNCSPYMLEHVPELSEVWPHNGLGGSDRITTADTQQILSSERRIAREVS